MKKLVSILLTLTLSTLCFGLIGCGQKTGKVMNVSLNPEVEFVLDTNDKVITANALNDEGNFIISQVTFKGLKAEEAVNAFIKVSKDNGFLLSGGVQAGENEIEIEISGEDARKLYEKVKTSATEKFNELSILATTTFEKLDKDYLKDVVEDLYLNLKESEIATKTEKELLDLIKKSREETKEFLSQELKEFYYLDRAKAIEQAKIQAFIDAINESGNDLLKLSVSQLQSALNTFTAKYTEFKNKFKEKFLDEDSDYQVKMREFIAKKKEYLQSRLENINTTILEQQLEIIESGLETVKELSMASVKAIDTAMVNTLTTIDGLITTVFSSFDASASVSVKVGEAERTFAVNFKSANQQFVSNAYWETLKPNVQA